MPDWFWYLVVFAYGAIVGSFLNVLIYRMPVGLSISSPPSRCPRCRTKLGFWDNVPLVSFLSLRARCRYCDVPIPWRYFAVELLTASLAVCLFARIGGELGVSWVDFAGQALFASILVAVIFIDLDHFIIPDELNVIGAGLAVARDVGYLALAWHAGDWFWKDARAEFFYFGWLPRALVGAVVYGGLLFLVSFFAFVYYAREEDESVASAGRRFFVFEEEGEDAAAAEGSSVTPHDDKAATSAEAAPRPTHAGEEVTDDEGEPARLRFSPGFLVGASALLLAPALRWGALTVVPLALGAFCAFSRRAGETFADTAGRFFRNADDGSETVPAGPISDAGPDNEAAGATPELTAAEEADQFAREAETGAHGGMGLGDVKLAVAIGALLGPGPALLSLFLATAAGAITGIGLAAVRGKGLRVGIPFGPFMAFGAVVVMLYGRDLVGWYLRTVGLR